VPTDRSQVPRFRVPGTDMIRGPEDGRDVTFNMYHIFGLNESPGDHELEDTPNGLNDGEFEDDGVTESGEYDFDGSDGHEEDE
jgi:hypothetical protein